MQKPDRKEPRKPPGLFDARAPPGVRFDLRGYMRHVVEYQLAAAAPSIASVVLYLLRWEKSGYVSASFRQIADTTGLGLATVHRAVHWLRRRGCLQLVHRSRHRGRASLYRFIHPKQEHQHEYIHRP